MFFGKRIIIIIIFLSAKLFSQNNISGIIFDKEGNTLPGANIKLLNKDSILILGTVSDSSGKFLISIEKKGNYILLFSYVGYRNQYKNTDLDNFNTDLVKIVLKQDPKTLGEVEVKGVQNRGEQKGDTTSFNADAFKTNPDATAEDLIKKMPGITSDNNGLKVNGEEVKKVMVDGKPFFGDDPNAAIRNLPAEVIDKVEIFDRMSDQSNFTGFNDGDQMKSINFITKRGKNVGQFGRIYGGVGADEKGDVKYNSGAVLNSFKAKRRVSLLLLSNNINQQNFSSADITGAMGNSGNSGRDRGGDRGSSGSSRGGSGGFSQSSALMAGQQNGISSTQSAGFNYSDEWGKKIEVSGSYFFNLSENKNYATLRRNYFGDDRLVYDQVNDDKTNNLNHRFNFRFEYKIDSVNKIIITPNLTYQDNIIRSNLFGENTILDTMFLSRTETNSKIGNTGYDFSNSILYQHKFSKYGRTISLNVNTQLTEKANDGNYLSYNIYSDTISGLDQIYATYGNTKKASLNLSYTEPLSKFSQFQISYLPSYYQGLSNKLTNDFNPITNQYLDFNSALSNKYFNVNQTQKAGLCYKYNKDKWNVSFGADAQQSVLNGDQSYPTEFKFNQSFLNILPNAQINYKFTKTNNLKINYRTSANIPNISQLQNVLDLTNPLQVKTGNNLLKQTFEQNISCRIGGFNPKTSRNIMMFIHGGIIDNNISNANYTLRRDTIIEGFEIKAGSQLTKPVNLNGYYYSRMFATYGFPIAAIKSNINVNGGINYNHTPGLNNDVVNFADNYAYNGGIYIGSNISQYFDFSVGYNGFYTDVRNSVQKQSNNTFFNHNISVKTNMIFFKSLVINTDVTHSLYNGLSQSFNQQFLLWNAYIGYKFLKNRSLEAKVSVFDILKQNKSISRTVTGNYTEDNNSVVLQRYGMFTVTYTIRNFKKGTPPKPEEPVNPYREIYKDSVPRHGGGGG